MSQSQKVHIYPYTFRSACLTAIPMCQDKIIMYLVPPENGLSIEQLYCHLKMTFDSGVAAGDRVVRWIGIYNEIPLFVQDEPAEQNRIDLNIAADVNRKVDIRVDLSSILTRDHVAYRDYFTDPETGDFTYVVIKLDDDLRGNNTVGTIDLWKLDGLFTTLGIR